MAAEKELDMLPKVNVCKSSQPSGYNSEGGCGNVGFQELMPNSFAALEIALNQLKVDHLKHLDKELSQFLLTRIAGLMRLQSNPAVSDKRWRRSWSLGKSPLRRA